MQFNNLQSVTRREVPYYDNPRRRSHSSKNKTIEAMLEDKIMGHDRSLEKKASTDYNHGSLWNYIRYPKIPSNLREFLETTDVNPIEKELVITAELYLSKNPKKKEMILTSTLEHLSDNQLIYYCLMELGKYHLKKGHKKVAFDEFESAMQFDDTRIGPYVAIASIHEDNKNYSQAAEILEKGHRYFQDDERYLKYSINIHKRCKHEKLVCRNYELLLDKQPEKSVFREYKDYLILTKNKKFIKYLTRMRHKGYRI